MTGCRRPGRNSSRGQILLIAQKLFADRGYDRTTLRRVATASGVDPALVSYYFKSKQELFMEAVLPIYEPQLKLPNFLEGDKSSIGTHLANYIELIAKVPPFVNRCRDRLSQPWPETCISFVPSGNGVCGST